MTQYWSKILFPAAEVQQDGGWTYTVLEPGSDLWSSPHRYQYLRDHTGTLDVSHDRHSSAPPPDR